MSKRADCFHDNGNHVVFRPMLMTPNELLEGDLYAYRSFYSIRSILKRTLKPRRHIFRVLALNFGRRLNYRYFEEGSPKKIVLMKTHDGENLSPEAPEIFPSTALMKDETSTESVKSSSETVDEKENPFKPHLSRTAIIIIAMLAGFSLAALRPIGWGILTGISLISSALMFRLIGTHLNSPFYFVFAVVYSTPMLFHLISKSWDIALVFTVCLGMPVIMISKSYYRFLRSGIERD